MTTTALHESTPHRANAESDLYLSLLKKALSASLYDESAWAHVEGTRGAWERKLSNPATYVRAAARSAIVRFLHRNRLMLLRRNAFDSADRREGVDIPLFGFTMAGHKRLDNLQACIEDVIARSIPGDLIETGVWRGGSTIFMRAVLKSLGDAKRKVWVADSFQGLPPPKDDQDGWDISHREQLAVSLDQVKANFQRFDLLDDQVRFLKGWFSETLPTAPIEKLAILRLDGDLYSSTMDALTALYPKVSAGGYVIVDDYGAWPACKRAIHEYIDKHNIKAEIEMVDYTCAFWRVQK